MLDETPETALRNTIDALIEAGTTADLRALDQIYHDRMQIQMVDQDDALTTADKPAFMAMLADMVDQSRGAANRWANYHVVEVDMNKGHVLITRKVKIGPEDRILTLSIDLFHEDGRWQVLREVIFARPNPQVTPN